MSELSVNKQDDIKFMEAIIEALKKEFPTEASTLIRDIIRIQIIIEN